MSQAGGSGFRHTGPGQVGQRTTRSSWDCLAPSKAGGTAQGASFVWGGGNKPLGRQMCRGEPGTGHFPKPAAGQGHLTRGLAPSQAGVEARQAEAPLQGPGQPPGCHDMPEQPRRAGQSSGHFTFSSSSAPRSPLQCRCQLPRPQVGKPSQQEAGHLSAVLVSEAATLVSVSIWLVAARSQTDPSCSPLSCGEDQVSSDTQLDRGQGQRGMRSARVGCT